MTNQARPSGAAPENIRGRGDFLKDIHGKSDRTVAIVAAALLNTHLEQLLTSFFVEDVDEARALLGNDRPLGNFGTRARAAYVCGLISKEEQEDLWAVSQIDEAFTREMGELTFADPPVSAWCLDMRLPNKIFLSGEDRTPRRMYVFTVGLLLRQLALRIDSAARERRLVREPFSLVEVKK